MRRFVFLVWALLIPSALSQCSNFITVAFAEAACPGTFTEYPLNGTKEPYNCSSCGSGLICGGGVCPPVLSDRKVFNKSICETPYSSTTNDFSCTALQKHCEDTGQGYLIFAKVFFFFPGSQYSCSNCSQGTVEMDEALTGGTHPDGLLEAPYDSAMLILLYIASIILFLAGLKAETYGLMEYDEYTSSDKMLMRQMNRQLKRFFLKTDTHGRELSFVQAVGSQAIVFRFILCPVLCTAKCFARVCGNDRDTRTDEQKARDFRLDVTYGTVGLCLAVALAILLNGSTRIFLTCELVYPGISKFPPLLGIIELPTIDPFSTALLPNDTFSIYPEVVENVNGVFTIVDKMFFSGEIIAVLVDFILEEVILLAALTGVETFANGCEEVLHWNPHLVHNILRVSGFLYMCLAIGVHQASFNGIPTSLAVGYVLTNLFFTLFFLSLFLVILAVPRRFVGNYIYDEPSQESSTTYKSEVYY